MLIVVQIKLNGVYLSNLILFKIIFPKYLIVQAEL